MFESHCWLTWLKEKTLRDLVIAIRLTSQMAVLIIWKTLFQVYFEGGHEFSGIKICALDRVDNKYFASPMAKSATSHRVKCSGVQMKWETKQKNVERVLTWELQALLKMSTQNVIFVQCLFVFFIYIIWKQLQYVPVPLWKMNWLALMLPMSLVC